jgi:hypothetical protein
MKRLTAGGLLTALAMAGTAVVAAPSFAGDGETGTFQGEATQVPLEASPGEQVRIFDTLCWEGTTDIWWVLRPEGGGPDVLATGQEALAGDGSWEVTLTAPDEPGWYLFNGLCLPPGVDTPDIALIDEIRSTEGPPPELFEEWSVDIVRYYSQIVMVVGPGTPTTTTPAPSTTETTVPAGPTTTVPSETPPAAPPAQPVPGTPTFAG